MEKMKPKSRTKEVEDLTGKKFGRWTVLGRAEDRYDKNGYVIKYWNCICDCGIEKEVLEKSLKHGHSKSCGCIKKELKPVKDLTGEKFNRWTVLKRGEDRFDKNGHILRTWVCQCDCGTIKTIYEASLKHGVSKSCGCLQKEIVSNISGKRDMIEKRFDRLIVREEAGINNQGQILWLCDCDCGGTIITTGTNLRTGGTHSCGCYNKDRIKESRYLLRSHNKYDISGKYGIGYTKDNIKFIFDVEDYEKIYPYLWYEKEDGYIVAHDLDNKRNIRLNRFVMNMVDENPLIRVDHKNHDVKDNRKSNLRISTNQENSRNHKLFTTNKSGTSGVRFNEDKNLWIAEITVNYKTIYLGGFKTKEEAVRMRKDAEEKHFGDFSYDNSINNN